eukprot:CAMPEP_0201492956 /NCGR_PEP_ID=MMETSP0151_2-20130828/35497_1 /ASSEMBLY_ACC=CAM_ASM_000257 /TAXON_ID=200890 /ORGANISM="Paramoeba atlantica, Strain 621/1 / CCAP 1560/9" /LENGTH=288 /DNA_ID=CAMNT_0047880061 /DNA_START=210 /DNA_END=1073 /DNA_ORIENTATION=-
MVLNQHPKKEQWITLNQDMFKKSFMVTLERDAAREFACLFAAILFQHMIGGMLCLPSYFGWSAFPPGCALALALNGALCELGWELEDSVYRIYQVLFTENGKKMNPPSLFIVLGAHHCLTMTLAIPMNLSQYRTDPAFHELVMLFQLAAAIALLMQQVGFFLDITKPKGLISMCVIVSVVWGTVIYSRFYRAIPLFYHFLVTFHEDGEQKFFIGACIAGGLMMIFNCLILLDSTAKLVKFLRLLVSSPKKKATPEEKATREKMLKYASSEVLAGQTIDLRPMGSFDFS